MGFNLMRSVGPAMGGAIVALAGAAAAFAVNAVSYVALIWALFSWSPERRERRLPREPLLGALSAGLRYMSMSPSLIRVMARGALVRDCGLSVLALLPVVARDMLAGHGADLWHSAGRLSGWGRSAGSWSAGGSAAR